MSKFAPIQKLNSDDFKESSEWFRSFLNSYNAMCDSLNAVLAGNVDIWNLRAEQRELTVTHATPFNVRLKFVPNFVAVGYAEGYVGVGAVTAHQSDGSVMTTVRFIDDVPTRPVKTLLWWW